MTFGGERMRWPQGEGLCELVLGVTVTTSGFRREALEKSACHGNRPLHCWATKARLFAYIFSTTASPRYTASSPNRLAPRYADSEAGIAHLPPAAMEPRQRYPGASLDRKPRPPPSTQHQLDHEVNRLVAMTERQKTEGKPEPEPTYRVYIRLPFNRGDFVDPPPVRKNPALCCRAWSLLEADT